MVASVHSFADHEEPARRLATALDSPWRPISVRRFPDDESLVRVVPQKGMAVVYCPLDHPNGRLVDLLLAASALHDAGALPVVLVAPYLCYMRQDVAFYPGEAVSQRVTARLLSDAFDRIVTVDPHLHRTHDLTTVFSIPVTQLSAATLLGAAIASDNPEGEVVLVGPDEESRPWVEAAARTVACSCLVGRKVRSSDRDVQIEIERADAVKGKIAVLVDDVVSTGSTVRKATRLLLDAGAVRADLYVTHMLSSDEDTAALRASGIVRIVSTDSVPHPTNVVRLASLLAGALVTE
ncbi:ribose-phosphate diphosphokinase [Mesorhizobium sp. ASY16-5R]|uniref:ribose-phosphate diphosphokinase n=1 Tax=Mesorhizobium sp. ASY16-5R TaxID=3445772 RepID=UPI003FA01330